MASGEISKRKSSYYQQFTSSYFPSLGVEEAKPPSIQPPACNCKSPSENKCPAGPPGNKGVAGRPGPDGIPGLAGVNGVDAEDQITSDTAFKGCFNCPAGPQG